MQNLIRSSYERALYVLLLEYLDIILDMCCSTHLGGHVGKHDDAAHFFKLAALLEFVRNGKYIYSSVFDDQRGHRLEDHAEFLVVEAGRCQFLHRGIHAGRLK